MSIYGYFIKLRKMNLSEVYFRFRQKVRLIYEIFKWKSSKKSGKSRFVPGWIKRMDFDQFPYPKDELIFFGLAENAESSKKQFKNHFPQAYQRTLVQADILLNDKFHLLGKEFELSSPNLWTRNPESGSDYPETHYGLIDFMDTDRYGDVKYVWELNRHQYFIEVTKAYFLTEDEKYAHKIWEWIESWIERNPFKIGINYTSVLENAVRIFSWVWALYFTKKSSIWTEERKQLFARSLILQGIQIEENLSYYYSPYNHLIGELAALSFLGTIFGNVKRMKKWRDKYWREMELQVEKQFYPDGFTVEQASYYHHFTLGFYLMLAILRKQNGLVVSELTWRLLEKAVEFPMFLTRPDGQIPMIGDIDNARSIYFYRPQNQWDLSSFIGLGAVLFKREDMKFIAGDVPEEVLWLLGEGGVNEFHKIKKKEPVLNSCNRGNSGYYIMRDGWGKLSNYCCFDCGEIAHGVFADDTPSAAHGHADIFSFELVIKGSPIIIDPGFHTYYGSEEWHRYFRSTRGHNTIEINRKGHAIYRDRITWSNASIPLLDFWLSCSDLDCVGGRINNFPTTDQAISHCRYILFRKGKYFLVLDEIQSKNSNKSLRIESTLHFAPGELNSKSRSVAYNQHNIYFSLPGSAKFQIQKGGRNPDEGWIAPGYGSVTPAPVLRINCHEVAPIQLGMLFPINSTENELDFKQFTRDDNVVNYMIQSSQENDAVYFNPSKKHYFMPENGIESNALLVISSQNPPEEEEIYFLDADFVKIPDKDFGDDIIKNGNRSFKLSKNNKPEFLDRKSATH